MRRKRKNESCECFLYSEARNVFAQIRRKIKRVSVDAIDDSSFNMSRPIEWPIWMDDGRARDNWNPCSILLWPPVLGCVCRFSMQIDVFVRI